MHDGHVDAGRAEFVGEHLGQRGDRDITYGPDDAPARTCGQARDVDDAPPTVGDHERRDFASAAQVAHHLHVDVVVKGFVGDLSQLGRDSRPAARAGRVVDEDVDAAELVAHLRHHCPDRLVVARFDLDGDDRAARRGAQLSRGIVQARPITRRDRDVASLSGERSRDCFADAAATTGDQRALTLEL